MSNSTKARMAGYIGSTIGILGWLIGFTLVCLFTGMTDILSDVFLPGLLISLLMAALLVLVLENTVQKFGAGHRMFQLSLWAMLLSEIGLMLFLINHWLAPLIDRHPDLAGKLNQMHSVYHISDFLPNVLMAVGLFLLIIVLRGTFKFSSGQNNGRPVKH